MPVAGEEKEFGVGLVCQAVLGMPGSSSSVPMGIPKGDGVHSADLLLSSCSQEHSLFAFQGRATACLGSPAGFPSHWDSILTVGFVNR